MTRTERLLNLLQILRTYRFPVTGHKLAERLGCSLRTLYRDIATLQAQGAEIRGEAGIGYVLKPGYFLPPLMFSQTEVEALVLGMLWVSTFGDEPLAKSAEIALAKLREVLPKEIRNSMNSMTLRVGPPASRTLATEDLSVLREALRHEKKMLVKYRMGRKSIREVVWPFAMGYFTDSRILVCWSEMQNQYLHISTKNILESEVLKQSYPRRREILFKEWQAIQLASIPT